MTTNLTFTDSSIIKIRETAFMAGLALAGSTIAFTDWVGNANTSLSYMGCILILQSIALRPYHKNRTKRNWLILTSLSLMLCLCFVLLFIGGGSYIPFAIALVLLNSAIIKKELK